MNLSGKNIHMIDMIENNLRVETLGIGDRLLGIVRENTLPE